MKIHVNQVPEEGLTKRATYDPATMDMDREDVRLTTPFEVEVLATRAAQELVVNASIRAPLRLSCARCLEEFESTVAPRGLFSYPVKPTEVVDITEDIRQEVILAFPMVPVCRPGCKGLCGTCGQNLNTASCGHPAAGEPGRDDQPQGGSIAV